MVQFIKSNVGGYTRWIAHADSVLDVAECLRDTPSKWVRALGGKNRLCVYDQGHGPAHSWDLGAGYEGAQKLALQGWSKGALNLSDKLGGRLPARDRSTAWRNDVAGEVPDIGRYMAGEPSHMRHRARNADLGRRPVISVAVNVWIRCDVRAQHMANYGAAMVAMIDRIEQGGKRVELRAGVTAPHCSDVYGTILSASWMVKRAEDPVDLGALAFSLAHPAASRRFGWALWERMDAQPDTLYGRGVGYAATPEDYIDLTPGALLVNGLNSNPHRCATLDDALVFVRDQLNDAAGEELVTVEG